jgi:hypothetical protein
MAIVALSALVFGAMKFVFWANSLVSLSLMNRVPPRNYWKWTPAEIVLSTVSSICFCSAIVLRSDSWLLAGPFVVATLSWLVYMARRVWLFSEPRRL